MDPAVWTAIAASGPAGVVVALFFIYGIPEIRKFLGWQSDREKEIAATAAALAKEGPVMVIAELRLQIAELKERCTKVEGKHEACEAETGSLRETIAVLEDANEKLEKRAADQDATIATHLKRIKELEEQVTLQGKAWKTVGVDVAAVKDQQTK